MAVLESPAAGRSARQAIAVSLVVVAGLVFGLRTLAGPAPEATPAPLPATSAETLQAQQQAREAATAQVGIPPWRGPIDVRPAFVAETEWQVLQGVARRHGDYARELQRLVNSLRFNKLVEEWRRGDLAPASRQALAEQLLAELPERVQHEDYGVADAEALQRELLAGLIADPAARAQRAGAEARRLRQPLLQASP